jgi:phage shock protein A
MIPDLPESTAPSEVATPGMQMPEVQEEETQEQAPNNYTQQAQDQWQKSKTKYEYNDPNKNIQAMRQKAEQAEKERDAYAKRLQELENQTEEFTLGSDDIAEGKHLKKMHSNLTKEIKNLKEELQTYRKQSYEAATEARIKATYHDFDSVVNSDNLAALRDRHPELMSTLQSSTDLYSQAVSAYTMIKNLGIGKPPSQEQQRVQSNIYKPRPSNSVSPQQGDTPLSRANAFAEGLTDDLKDQLRKEMYSSMKNY